MFHSISWQQYLNLILFLLSGYYLVIGWLFFRPKIKAAGELFRPAATPAANPHAPAMDLLKSVQESMELIGALLDTAASRKYNKEALLNGIKTILARYPLVKGSLFEISINQWLIARAAAACRIELSAIELQRCW